MRKIVFVFSILSFFFTSFPTAIGESATTSVSCAEVEKVWMSLTERFGLWAALCVALVGALLCFSWLREKRMAKRIDDLEEERAKQATSVATALTRNGDALSQIVEIQKKQLEEQQKLSVELHCRPCLK
jgi:Flp pilus assembly protein TadB